MIGRLIPVELCLHTSIIGEGNQGSDNLPQSQPLQALFVDFHLQSQRSLQIEQFATYIDDQRLIPRLSAPNVVYAPISASLICYRQGASMGFLVPIASYPSMGSEGTPLNICNNMIMRLFWRWMSKLPRQPNLHIYTPTISRVVDPVLRLPY